MASITDGSEVCSLCGEWKTGCSLCGTAPMQKSKPTLKEESQWKQWRTTKNVQ
jgi:hypothetical protein